MQQISLNQAYKDLQEKKDVIFVDVRTPQEFEKTHIENAINIPLDELSEKIKQKIPKKDTILYVYCLSSSRSAIAVHMLQNLNYSHAYNLEYGLLGWRTKGYPLK